jgi:hypothetical protein
LQQTIRNYSTLIVAIVSSVLTILCAPASQAFNLGLQEGVDSAKGADQATDLFGVDGVFTTITNVLLFVIGAISVIMIIIGGIRYVVSGGDSANVTAAKNTILYAVVGIIVAILAYALVHFVVTSFTASGGSGGTNV